MVLTVYFRIVATGLLFYSSAHVLLIENNPFLDNTHNAICFIFDIMKHYSSYI